MVGYNMNTKLQIFELSTMETVKTIELSNNASRDTEQFSVVSYIPELSLIAVADNLRKCFMFLKLSYDALIQEETTYRIIEDIRSKNELYRHTTSKLTVDWMIDCPITHPVIGFQYLLSGGDKLSENPNQGSLSLYAVQNKSVQEYRIEGDLSISNVDYHEKEIQDVVSQSNISGVLERSIPEDTEPQEKEICETFEEPVAPVIMNDTQPRDSNPEEKDLFNRLQALLDAQTKTIRKILWHFFCHTNLIRFFRELPRRVTDKTAEL
jgi:hypothetical protein